jgi:hypothetical protein
MAKIKFTAEELAECVRRQKRESYMRRTSTPEGFMKQREYNRNYAALYRARHQAALRDAATVDHGGIDTFLSPSASQPADPPPPAALSPCMPSIWPAGSYSVN